MKLANSIPPYCSSCFSQKLGQRHIDFEAYWDGPVIDQGNGMKQTIDDLMICEDCIRRAAELVGMVSDTETADRLEAMKTELGSLRALRARNAGVLAKVRKAVGE